VLRTLKSVLKYLQAAQKTEKKSESESEIAMCDRMQMYNIIYNKAARRRQHNLKNLLNNIIVV
jgi:hypothetical protein